MLTIAPMLKPEDVAHALVISVRQVRRMAARGEIPGAIRVGRGRWRFRVNEVRAFIEGKMGGAHLAGAH